MYKTDVTSRRDPTAGLLSQLLPLIVSGPDQTSRLAHSRLGTMAALFSRTMRTPQPVCPRPAPTRPCSPGPRYLPYARNATTHTSLRRGQQNDVILRWPDFREAACCRVSHSLCSIAEAGVLPALPAASRKRKKTDFRDRDQISIFWPTSTGDAFLGPEPRRRPLPPQAALADRRTPTYCRNHHPSSKGHDREELREKVSPPTPRKEATNKYFPASRSAVRKTPAHPPVI